MDTSKQAARQGRAGRGSDRPAEAPGGLLVTRMLTLPYPRTSGNGKSRVGPGSRVYSAEDSRQYELDVKRVVVASRWSGQTLDMPVEVHFDAWPPDRRERDSDNVEKVLKDALTKAGFWRTDSNHLIRRSVFTWHDVDHEEAPNGVVVVSTKPFKESQ